MISIEEFLFSESHGFIKNSTKPNVVDGEKSSYINPDGSIYLKYHDGTVWYYGTNETEGKIFPDGSAYYIDPSLKREGKIFADGSGYFLDYDEKIYQKCGNNTFRWSMQASSAQEYSEKNNAENDHSINDKYNSLNVSDHYLKSVFEQVVKSSSEKHDETEKSEIKNALEKENGKREYLERENRELNRKLESEIRKSGQLEQENRELRKRLDRCTQLQSTNGQKTNEKNEDVTIKKNNPVFKILVLLLIVALIAVIVLIFIYEKYYISIGYSSDELMNMNSNVVKEYLNNEGFTNVKTEAIEDLNLENISMEDAVIEVSCGGATFFSASKKFNPGQEIIIKYHSLQKILVPFGSKEISKMNFSEVVEAFSSAGFVNITVEPDYDLITGWINSDGEVKKITIGDEDSFKADTTFRPDEPIVITYHAK